jgi:hypothetical protein
MSTWTVARQIAFYGTTTGGKWHAAWLITHTPVCGTPATLVTDSPIRTHVGQSSADVHRVVCRRCLRLSTWPGVSGNGIGR